MKKYAQGQLLYNNPSSVSGWIGIVTVFSSVFHVRTFGLKKLQDLLAYNSYVVLFSTQEVLEKKEAEIRLTQI